jgi:hypothetical protein
MVLLKTTLTGTLLIAVGILLLTVAGPYFTTQVQVVQRHDVDSHAQFLVGDVIDRQYSLPADVTVLGTLDVTQAPTNQTGSIQFIVFDAQNYQLWQAGQQSSFIFTSTPQDHSNFTFNTGSSGIYHLVFDNRASIYKKYVAMSVSYNAVSVSNQPNPHVPYVGWGILAVGLIVLVYGIARKPPISWA